MDLAIISEIWDALRNHIDFNDRSDASDTIVNLLIEHNYEPDDIKEAFRGDKDISVALKYYADQHDMDEEYEDEETDEDSDEDSDW
jgi:hypothetical protein